MPRKRSRPQLAEECGRQAERARPVKLPRAAPAPGHPVWTLPRVWLYLYDLLEEGDVLCTLARVCSQWRGIVMGNPAAFDALPRTRPPRKRRDVVVLPSPDAALRVVCARPVGAAAFMLRLRGLHTGSLEGNARLLRVAVDACGSGTPLRVLDLHGFPLATEDFERVVAPGDGRGCIAVRRIHLGGCSVGDKGRCKPMVRLLHRLPRLHTVTLDRLGALHGCWVTALSKAAPRLRRLCLAGCRAMGTKGPGVAIRKFPQLRELCLRGIRLDSHVVPDTCATHDGSTAKAGASCGCCEAIRLLSHDARKAKPPTRKQRAQGACFDAVSVACVEELVHADDPATPTTRVVRVRCLAPHH